MCTRRHENVCRVARLPPATCYTTICQVTDPLPGGRQEAHRRTVKQQRAIVGASLDVIKERRSQRPEARSAARAAAVKEGKDKKAASESAKKAEKAKSAAAGARGQAAKIQSKQGSKGAAPKVQARTR